MISTSSPPKLLSSNFSYSFAMYLARPLLSPLHEPMITILPFSPVPLQLTFGLIATHIFRKPRLKRPSPNCSRRDLSAPVPALFLHPSYWSKRKMVLCGCVWIIRPLTMLPLKIAFRFLWWTNYSTSSTRPPYFLSWIFAQVITKYGSMRLTFPKLHSALMTVTTNFSSCPLDWPTPRPLFRV